MCSVAKTCLDRPVTENFMGTDMRPHAPSPEHQLKSPRVVQPAVTQSWCDKGMAKLPVHKSLAGRSHQQLNIFWFSGLEQGNHQNHWKLHVYRISLP
jgi:hypothetical protein